MEKPIIIELQLSLSLRVSRKGATPLSVFIRVYPWPIPTYPTTEKPPPKRVANRNMAVAILDTGLKPLILHGIVALRNISP